MADLRFLRACLVGSSLLVTPFTAQAAGGHHAVDDAGILEPGQCELETWFARDAARDKLLHAGAGCRVGPLELGLAADHARGSGASATGWSLQGKWATPLADGFDVGLSLAAAWQGGAKPRYQGVTLVALATWTLDERLALHANLGRDFAHRGDDESRYGVSAEWMVRTGWQLVAERYRESGTHFARAGLRWALSDAWSVDLSRSQRLAGPAPSAWTLGATWLLERSPPPRR